MAEDKEKKPPQASDDVFANMAIIAVVLFFVISILSTFAWDWIRVAVDQYLPVFSFGIHVISIVITVCSVFGLLYYSKRISALVSEQRKRLYPDASQGPETVGTVIKNERWERIKKLINSENSNDWKAAIMEADIMLNEMLDTLGYHGDSIGEKLKQVERSDFLTLNSAWEAHKIRNAVAHQGDKALSHREAKLAIENYQTVFEEFYYV